MPSVFQGCCKTSSCPKIVNAYDEYDKKAESKKQVKAQIKVKDRRNDH